MAIIQYPGFYPTLQETIDNAQPGDTILIAPNTTLSENLVITTNNLTIEGPVSTNLNSTPGANGTGLMIQADNVTVRGLAFYNYFIAVSIIGNHNAIEDLLLVNSDRNHVFILGDYNSMMDCKLNICQNAAVTVAGRYNMFMYNSITNCTHAIIGTYIPTVGSIFAYNVTRDCTAANYVIYTDGSDKNVFFKNVMDVSGYGILGSFGRFVVCSNMISHCRTGICLQSDCCNISSNSLVDCANGIECSTNNTCVTGNSLQTGIYTGISLTGNNNTVTDNVVYDYQNIGLLLNGVCNKEECNKLCDNGTELIENEVGASTGCACRALTDFLQDTFNADESFLDMLDVFKRRDSGKKK